VEHVKIASCDGLDTKVIIDYEQFPIHCRLCASMEHLFHKCLVLGVKRLTRLPISTDGSNIGKRQGLTPFLLNQHLNEYEEGFIKIRWK
jgi:hypothetical protein